MLTFIVVAIIFWLLVRYFVQQKPVVNFDRKDIAELVFKLPREIIANDRPEGMPIDEREKRRRRLLNEMYQLGIHAREAYEAKQQEDLILARTPYFYPLKKSNLCLSNHEPKTNKH